jgi:hypothetical protein
MKLTKIKEGRWVGKYRDDDTGDLWDAHVVAYRWPDQLVKVKKKGFKKKANKW